MPGGNRVQLGNELFEQVLYLPSVTYPTIGANTSVTNTVTVSGVLPLDVVTWNMQAPPAHLVIDNIYVSSANTLTVLWSSDSTGISTGTVSVIMTVDRAENASLGSAALPSVLT